MLAALRTDSQFGFGERVAAAFENWTSCQKSSRAKLDDSRVSGATEAKGDGGSKNGPSRSDAQKKRANAQVNRQKCGAFLSVLNLQLGW